MRPHELQILQYVADTGPCSCASIATALNIDRQRVYRFLYKARCYDDGKGWIDNIKPIPPLGDPNYGAANFQTPGQYVITDAGRHMLQLTAEP